MRSFWTTVAYSHFDVFAATTLCSKTSVIGIFYSQLSRWNGEVGLISRWLQLSIWFTSRHGTVFIKVTQCKNKKHCIKVVLTVPWHEQVSYSETREKFHSVAKTDCCTLLPLLVQYDFCDTDSTDTGVQIAVYKHSKNIFDEHGS